MKKKNFPQAFRLFSELNKALIGLKYEELTPEKRRQIEADAEIEMPEAKRLKLTQDQAAFVRHYDHGYTAKFYTGYMPRQKDFAPKDMYGMQVVVVNADNQLVYYRQIYRKGGFVKRSILEVKFVHHLLSNLPLSKNKSRMLLVRDENDIPILRSIDNKEEKSILEFPPLNNEVRKAAISHWRGKRYYAETGREKRGVTRRISDIKNKSKVLNVNGL
jgi:hypothetical protein